MNMRNAMMGIGISWMMSAGAFGQSGMDAAFTATGSSCDQVTWSPDSLAKYPNIAKACQAVLQRDGRYFVKFGGEVKRVADRGKKLTVAFKDGDRLTLNPPEDLTVDINGKATPIARLRPGDMLTFYVAQDRLAANMSADNNAVAPLVPIAPAPEEPSGSMMASKDLPRTASALPTIGLAGLLLVGLGAALTLRRRMARDA